MKSCAYPNCFNRSSSSKLLSMFTFPSDKSLFEKWCNRSGRLDYLDKNMHLRKHGSRPKLCSVHFNPKFIRSSKGGGTRQLLRKLKSSALPFAYTIPMPASSTAVTSSSTDIDIKGNPGRRLTPEGQTSNLPTLKKPVESQMKVSSRGIDKRLLSEDVDHCKNRNGQWLVEEVYVNEEPTIDFQQQEVEPIISSSLNEYHTAHLLYKEFVQDSYPILSPEQDALLVKPETDLSIPSQDSSDVPLNYANLQQYTVTSNHHESEYFDYKIKEENTELCENFVKEEVDIFEETEESEATLHMPIFININKELKEGAEKAHESVDTSITEGASHIDSQEIGMVANRKKSSLMMSDSEKSHKCPYCTQLFNVIGKLEDHLLTHRKERPFEYRLCGRMFRERGALNVHHLIHTGEKPHKCTFCSATFRQCSVLKRHMLRHLEGKRYPCQHCNMNFQQKCHLKTHLKVHTKENDIQRCHYCGIKFWRKKSLEAHILAHTGGGKRCECKHCDKISHLRGAINRHMLIHSKERHHECKQCGKSYTTEAILNNHILTHTNGKQHECPSVLQ